MAATTAVPTLLRIVVVVVVVVMVTSLIAGVESFLVVSPPTRRLTSLHEGFFTGGVVFGESQAETDEAAAKLAASKVKSVSNLGWTDAPKRRGETRPRHRAYGGSTELPIQLKANYDPSRPNCVEKWLTQEEFNTRVVGTSGPAADTIFCALAGGAAFAERQVCLEKLDQWFPSKKFDRAAFQQSVNDGRRDLAVGWLLWGSVVTFCALNIALPTNPVNRAAETAIASLLGQTP